MEKSWPPGRADQPWPHCLAAPLNCVAGSCPLVLLLSSGRADQPSLNSVAGSCPPLVLWPRLATLTGRAPQLCGRALWPGLVLLLSSLFLLLSSKISVFGLKSCMGLPNYPASHCSQSYTFVAVQPPWHSFSFHSAALATAATTPFHCRCERFVCRAHQNRRLATL